MKKMLLSWLLAWLPNQRPSPDLVPPSKDELASILTLQYHPGFLALTRLHAIRKQHFQDALCTTRQNEIRDVDRLQAAIAEMTFLQDEVTRRTTRAAKPRRVEQEDELQQEFARIKSHINLIGPQGS